MAAHDTFKIACPECQGRAMIRHHGTDPIPCTGCLGTGSLIPPDSSHNSLFAPVRDLQAEMAELFARTRERLALHDSKVRGHTTYSSQKMAVLTQDELVRQLGRLLKDFEPSAGLEPFGYYPEDRVAMRNGSV